MLNAKLFKDGVITETTDEILTSMRHGIIDPKRSVRELLRNYADRLEIAIRREAWKTDCTTIAKCEASANEDRCTDTEKRSDLGHVLDMPEIGLHFDRIRSDGITYFIGKWKNDQYNHVYTLKVQKVGSMWSAAGENDGRQIFALGSPSRHHCEWLGYAALRKYIRIGHRRTLKRLKKKNTEDVPNGTAH